MSKRKNNKLKTTTNENKAGNKFLIRSIIFFLITLVIASTYFFKDKIENFVNFAYNENILSTVIESDGLIIHFIDVGQADATLIEFPTGEKMLIDCGDSAAKSHDKFVSYLDTIDFKTEGDEKVIDYLILTHPDQDHIGGAEYILENFKVKACFRPDVYSANEILPADTSLIVQSYSAVYARVISLLEEEIQFSGCISIRTVQELEITSSSYNSATAETDPTSWILKFYAPITTELPYRNNANNPADLTPVSNDYSPIMILTYLDKQIMFTGDASDKVEKSFVDYYSPFESVIDFDVDILKLGHHGSRYSSCEIFLDFVTPEYAIASAGLNNQYGHPSSHTLERLKSHGIKTHDIYRTDLNGNIIIGISQTGIMSLNAAYVQYSSFKFEWWMIFLISDGVVLIVMFSPYAIKTIKKHGRTEK